MRIDASAAIKRLGIRHPVRFVSRDLRDGSLAAVHPTDPTTVMVDVDALWRAAHGGHDPAQTIAHELVHVAQMQEIGDPLTAGLAYERESASYGYKGNRFEVEARDLESWLAPLVKVVV